MKELKSLLMWFLIIFLSLHAYGMYKDRQLEKESRKRWMDKAEEFLNTAADLACSKDYRNKSSDEVIEALDHWLDKVYLVHLDNDYGYLTHEEQVAFRSTLYRIADMFHNACHKIDQLTPEMFTGLN